MIKNLVFDFGGVLTTIDTQQAIQRFTKLGLKDAHLFLNSYKQTGIFYQLENGDISAENFVAELEKSCNRKISYQEVMDAWMGFIVNVQNELIEFLQSIRDKYRLCILSNTNPFLQNWARSEKFTQCGKSLDDYFDDLYLSYLMGCSKPDKEIYIKMLNTGNMKPEETLFIDDSIKNIETAKEIGIQTLKAINGENCKNELKKILLL